MKTIHWKIKPAPDPTLMDTLTRGLNIHPILASLLIQRGHDSVDKAREFFDPTVTMLHDPFLMKDMEQAVNRIEKAIANNEKIMVYGDYDVDGTTSVAMMYLYLIERYNQVTFYIPHRYTEGYGVSTKGIDVAQEHGIKLIIALDCGIKSVDKVQYAKELGIDFIICDHHRPGAEIPDAAAVLDPKRPDCNYPFKELSGCGVGFKLICALVMHQKADPEKAYRYLDLVAVSTAADMVPITGENRVLTFFGLKAINKRSRPGLKAILDIAGKTGEVTVNDVVFAIAPRINAAGRIESGNQAVELLIAASADEARRFSEAINIQNNTRKGLNEDITRKAMEQIRSDTGHSQRKSTVVYGPDWHKGVLGIVASKLTDEFYRPTIVLTRSNGVLAGSARSVKDFDVYNAIESCSELLEQFGGHMYAAGLTMREENYEAFKERFEDEVSRSIEERMLIREIEVDAAIHLHDIDHGFFQTLKKFEPFGPGNLSPVFASQKVYDRGAARIVGVNHLKLSLYQQQHSGHVMEGIAFQLGRHYQHVYKGNPIEICYHVEQNVFNGITRLQLNIKDIRY